MARYSHAIWKPVERYDVGGPNHVSMEAHRRLVLHTAVSDSDSLFALFNTAGNPVAHFYVREDGKVEQYVDTAIRSSAVLEGNPDSITVESWDGYPHTFRDGQPPEWTDAQLDTLVDLAQWCHDTHGIPLTRLPDTRPGTEGIGWHRQGCDGNFPRRGLLRGRVAGGESWSPSFGKGCPGDNRIPQITNAIIPRANGEDDMSAEDVKNIRGDIAELKARVNEIATNERERDAKKQAAVLDAVAKIPAGPEGSIDAETVKQAIREVFGSLDEGEPS